MNSLEKQFTNINNSEHGSDLFGLVLDCGQNIDTKRDLDIVWGLLYAVGKHPLLSH